MTHHAALLFCLGCLIIGISSLASADESAPGAQLQEHEAIDSIASLKQLQLQNLYSGAYHNQQDKSGNSILLRLLAPFRIGSREHLARASLSFITKSPTGKSGLNDLVIFDLLIFHQSWGGWGVGPAVLIPTATDMKLGSEKWGMGPALGFETHSGNLSWSIFSQSLVSFAGNDARKDVKNSALQPILSYPLSNGWSLGSSEMNFVYDWKKSDWIALPVGGKLAKMMKFDKQYLQFSGAYEYNLATHQTGPAWTANFTVKYLFPL